MMERLWKKALQEKRDIFEKDEIVAEIGQEGLRAMLRLGVLHHLSIEDYPYCVRCLCPDGTNKEITFLNGKAFGFCEDYPDEPMTPIDVENWAQYRLDKGEILAILKKRTGIKGEVKKDARGWYAMGFWPGKDRAIPIFFADSRSLTQGEILGKTIEYLGKSPVIVLTHDQGLFEKIDRELVQGQEIYVLKLEEFVDWGSQKLRVKEILDGIGKSALRITEPMRKEYEKCGYRTEIRVEIEGTSLGGKRFRVWLDGEERELGEKGILLLARLGKALLSKKDCGWIAQEQLQSEGFISWDNPWQPIRRLRRDLGDREKKLIESSVKRYRLSTFPEFVKINYANLEKLRK